MYFDIVMPLTLFIVTTVAMFLNQKVEKKFKDVFEERKVGVWNVVVLVAAIGITVSLVVFAPQIAIMTMFLFAYSMILFLFTYLFSNFPKTEAQLLCFGFLVASFAAATISLFNFGANITIAYGALAFFCLFAFTLIALLYEESRTGKGERWYFAVLSPALFILLYVFFSRTPIWFPYLLNLYGLIFAILTILYLGSLFTWKTTLIFAGLLTVIDVILVLVTGTMVSAATHVYGLMLPVLVSLPILPSIATELGVLYMSLGLGDFFFAGVICIQTMKKFGKSSAVLSVIAISISFFIFEGFILTYKIRAFPGTLMIICGWLPLILWKSLKH